jgi:hypothetical protein
MQDQDENREPSYPKNLGQILDALPSPANSASMSKAPAGNSLTIGREEGRPAPIGKPPSETVLETLRNIAQNVSNGRPMDDQTLEMSLVQHFGSSRIECKKKFSHVYGTDGGYDREVERYEISLDCIHDCEMKLFDALEFLNRPARGDFVAKQIGRLRAVMARRAESNEDIAVVIDVYTDHLEKYPPDVIAAVCSQIIERGKWFPLVSDLVKQCDALVAFRRAIMRCFEDARNPLLAKKTEAKRIAADPRLGMHWKELPDKKTWLPCHWDWYLGDAEYMIKYFRDQGRTIEADAAQVEFERRLAEAQQVAA